VAPAGKIHLRLHPLLASCIDLFTFVSPNLRQTFDRAYRKLSGGGSLVSHCAMTGVLAKVSPMPRMYPVYLHGCVFGKPRAFSLSELFTSKELRSLDWRNNVKRN
jgi:hypothetical protein